MAQEGRDTGQGGWGLTQTQQTAPPWRQALQISDWDTGAGARGSLGTSWRLGGIPDWKVVSQMFARNDPLGKKEK